MSDKAKKRDPEGLIDEVENIISELVDSATEDDSRVVGVSETDELSERLLAMFVQQENVLDTYKEMLSETHQPRKAKT